MADSKGKTMVQPPKSTETRYPCNEMGRTALHHAINVGLIRPGAESRCCEGTWQKIGGAGSGPALGTRGVFMQSAVLVCACIHVDQVDVLAVNEHLCAVGSDGPGEGSGSTGESSYIR